MVSVLPAFGDMEAKLAPERTLRNKAIIAIALYGDLRAREIQNLKLADFVPIQDPIGFIRKVGKQQSVALPRQALAIVSAWLAKDPMLAGRTDPLIPKEDGSGDALSYHVINRAVTGWTTRHLGARLMPHRLRHATASTVWSGGEIDIIPEDLGHA